MKKKTLTSLLAVCLALSLAACGGGGGSSAPSDSGSSTTSGSGNDSSSRSEPETPPEEPSPFVEVALGETITVAGVDFTFDTQETAKELLPTTPNNGNYRAIHEQEGFTLFYIKGTVTNNSDADYQISLIECKCVKNDGSPWISPHFYIDNDRGISSTAVIAPGETYTCYFADLLETDWLENEYETYQLLFQIPESYETKPDSLDSGYSMTFHK